LAVVARRSYPATRGRLLRISIAGSDTLALASARADPLNASSDSSTKTEASPSTHAQFPTSWLSKVEPTRRVNPYPTSTATLRNPAAAHARTSFDDEPRRYGHGHCDERNVTEAEQRRLLERGDDLHEMDNRDSARVVGLDLAVVLPDLDVRERCEWLRELLVEHITLQGERRAVARAVEACSSLVEPQEAALVSAHSRDRRKVAVGVHHEPDVRYGRESRDLTIAEIGGIENRLPGPFVGHQLLRSRNRL